MFSGEKLLEDLRSDNSLMKTMVDRFGEDVTDQYQTGRSAYLLDCYKNLMKRPFKKQLI